MSAFTHGFNHGFAAGILNRMFGGFGMFNFNCWNSAPMFFTPSYSFNKFFQYQTPVMPPPIVDYAHISSSTTPSWNNMQLSSFSTNMPMAGLVSTQTNWSASNSNQNTNWQMSNFQNTYGWGDVFVRNTSSISSKKLSKTGCNTYNAIIEKYAKKYNVNPNLVKAVIKQESSFNAKAVSPAGAKGLMQLMPATASELKVSNAFDPEQNIEGGVKYLSQLLKKYNGNTKLALAAYNAGMANVKNGKIPQNGQTPKYVDTVMKYYNEYQRA